MRYIIIVYLIVLISGCKFDRTAAYRQSTGKGNEYAKLFSVSDSGSYYKLDIYSPWQGAEDVVLTYYLAENAKTVPPGIADNRIIQIPVRSCVCLSTTHIAMIDAAGGSKSILGVSGTEYVSNQEIRKSIGEGSVRDIGYDSNLNSELIASLDPEVVFVYGVGSESAGYISKLEEVGITSLYICDYLELHPLAKAEWVKLFGLLYNTKEDTDLLFSEVRDNYEEIRSYVKLNSSFRPRVMLGLPYKDKWFISPGNSYINTLIEDAGGDYIWRDHISNESMPLSIESVFRESLNSDFWLNIGNVRTSEELFGIDARFKELPPVKRGNLYNNLLRTTPEGGNDYWESGAIFPDRILSDIASILHPEIFDDHTLSYYIKVK